MVEYLLSQGVFYDDRSIRGLGTGLPPVDLLDIDWLLPSRCTSAEETLNMVALVDVVGMRIGRLASTVQVASA